LCAAANSSARWLGTTSGDDENVARLEADRQRSGDYCGQIGAGLDLRKTLDSGGGEHPVSEMSGAGWRAL
jgi:hypothetical protein